MLLPASANSHFPAVLSNTAWPEQVEAKSAILVETKNMTVIHFG